MVANVLVPNDTASANSPVATPSISTLYDTSRHYHADDDIESPPHTDWNAVPLNEPATDRLADATETLSRAREMKEKLQQKATATPITLEEYAKRHDYRLFAVITIAALVLLLLFGVYWAVYLTA
jgi:hypothetical protein